MKIAIVEDNPSDAKLLKSFLDRYSEENKIQFEVKQFEDGMNFVENYCRDFGLIFLDIEMPHLNGMESAKEIRMIDPDVTIIFVTNMSQYAIEGYEVSAVGFMVKPISYFAFQKLMTKVVKNHIGTNEEKITIKKNGNIAFLAPSQIFYVEAMGHNLIYHTKSGDYSTNERLKNVALKLAAYNFFQIKSCYLVNLRYVSLVKSDSVVVDGAELTIARRTKKEFLAAMASYMGKGGR